MARVAQARLRGSIVGQEQKTFAVIVEPPRRINILQPDELAERCTRLAVRETRQYLKRLVEQQTAHSALILRRRARRPCGIILRAARLHRAGSTPLQLPAPSLEDALASSGAPAIAGCEIRGAMPAGFDSILTRDALDFLATLARRFTPRVHELLAARERRQRALDAGELPDFLPETRAI